ncbi:ATPdependent RNA helicase [Bulinus truncatus]|nr:ATPdependent RNA helicase [Bulinus truncatus]
MQRKNGDSHGIECKLQAFVLNVRMIWLTRFICWFYHVYDIKELWKAFLQEEFHNKKSEAYQEMLQERQLLPAWESRELIISAVARHQVIIVSGMTGCGKTTQVPQFILDDALQTDDFNVNIVCTQPRRISATSIAERVAAERDDTLGKLVGYQIRLDADVSHFTRLLFCTTGIVIRRLEGDPNLEGVTHIIIDEVHERSELSDFLILVIKKLLVRRPELRVILMSATINAKLFSEYFDNCPVISIRGQTFPVRQFFLEDVIEKTSYRIQDKKKFSSRYSEKDKKYNHGDPSGKTPDWLVSISELFTRYNHCSTSTIDTLATMDIEKLNSELVVHLLKWIITGQHEEFPPDGAILVFLPGYGEIEDIYDELTKCEEISCNTDKYVIIPLHSSFSSDEQKAVFHRPKPGIRKIVLSTNLAETSITIDDIVYVVDAGWMKEMRYDPSRKMQSLDTILVSKTNAEQRKGRACRVQEGVCFHLFTSHTFHNVLRPHPKPEIQRNSLEQVVIRTKILSIFRGQDVELVLQDLINAPKADRIHDAVGLLKDLGALDSNGELTALGHHIGSLPVDVKIGKLMLYGATFRCLDATLTIAAALSYKSPFISPFKKAKEATWKKRELAVHDSDILTMLRAYQDWWKAKPNEYSFCREFFLSRRNLQMMTTLKQQYVENLSDIGFVKKGITSKDVQASAIRNSDGANANNENLELLSALLVAALYPNIAEALFGRAINMCSSEPLFQTRIGDLVRIHPSSVNHDINFENGSFQVYLQKVRTKKVYIRECSLISHLSLLMFGGGSIEVTEILDDVLIGIDDKIKFKTDHEC